MTFYQQIKVLKSEIVLDMRGSFVVHFTHLNDSGAKKRTPRKIMKFSDFHEQLTKVRMAFFETSFFNLARPESGAGTAKWNNDIEYQLSPKKKGKTK